MIAVRGLSFGFRGGDGDVLRDVSLDIEAGEFVVVSGPSGCGKSTLALALGGYLWRQFDGQGAGTITVAGLDARLCPMQALAEVVGLVQQDPEAQFCTLTVADEVAFGLENRCLPADKIRERMAWALAVVGAGHLAGRALATLSGGEKQKVAIAAMMAAQPQVLILDEPTSNLDPAATAGIFEAIARIRVEAGITVIVVEHKVDYLRPFAPRLVALDEGRLVYDGPLAGAPRPEPAPPAPLPPVPGTARPLLHIEDLHASQAGRPVLRGVSAEVRPGELVAVMGDNGSGKTTFLHALLGLIKPDRGRVLVLDQDTRQAPVSRLARDVGLVFQNPDHQLLAESVWQEALLAPRNLRLLDAACEALARDLLEHCGLAGRAADHPYRLSYGQKRRLNLVSILSYAPRLVLMDEMLIGQDPVNAAFLLSLVAGGVRRGGAAILVNHAPDVARCYANRLLFFDGGRIVVDAPPDEAFDRLAALGRWAYLPAGPGAPVRGAAA